MSYLTNEEILKAYPFGPPYRLMGYHDPAKWNLIHNYSLGIPIRLKFNENIRNKMPKNIRYGKGIYMFFVEPNHPFNKNILIRHLLYVGRVQAGKTSHNFYKRFYKYVKAIGNKNTARNVMRLTNCWPDNTFVYYFDLSTRTDEEIADIESNIFNNIIPPLNEELHGEARLTRQFY